MAGEELLGSLPLNWLYTTLGDACAQGGGDVQTGPFGSQLHASDYVKEGIPSIMPQNRGDNRVIEDGIARIRQEDAERLGRYRVRVGDIVYSRRGDVEKRALIREREDGWLCGTGCLRVRFGDHVVNPVYASYYLGHPSVREWIVRHAHGATMPNLNTSILSMLPFVVPPMQEQHAIAHILGTLDDKIELNQQMNQTLEQMARAIFKSWFVDLDPVRTKVEGREPGMPEEVADLFPDSFEDSELEKIPAGWKVGSILSRAKLLSGGTPKTDRQEYWNGDIAWASAKDVSQCGETFLIATERTITELGLEESATQLISAFCTVVVARGATTGRMVLVGREMAMNQTCYALTSSTDTPFAPYCQLRDEMDGLVHQAHGSVFDTITTSSFASSKVVLPSVAATQAFERVVAPFFRRILANTDESRTLAALRDTLLPKLISGELGIPDAERLAARYA
ncbi:MAG TPA: restriction endonuclease subunit S [Candidatus Binatia bacterium]|jgi:type I restriction enzyme S subunit|nr:restriction endonuclease subunit S [Candidatus Binatia bacterium]